MRTACLIFMLAVAACAADFYSGQAARAVIGQPSFSARESGIAANALTVTHGRLNAAEAAKLVSFDLSRPTGNSRCAVCGFAIAASANQIVSRESARFATFGHVVAAIDTTNKNVLIWRNTRGSSAQADIVLGKNKADALGAGTLLNPVSVAYDGHRLFVGDAALHRVLVWDSLPVADDEPADAVLGQPDFTTVNSAPTPSADSVGIPAALASDGTNLYVADSDNRRILIFTPADVLLSSDAVVNSASLSNQAFAPGTLVTIRAKGLAQQSEAAVPSLTDKLPKRLANTEVILNGIALPLLSVSPEEIQTQLPYDLGNATSGSLVVKGAATTTAVAVNLAATSPAIFAVGEREPRSGLLLHAALNMESASSPAQGSPITEENPAKPGETVTIWANGLGSVDTDSVAEGEPFSGSGARAILPVTAIVNGEVMDVITAKLPAGAVGVYEVTILLPQALATAQEVRLQLFQNAVPSNIVTIPVKQ